MRLSRLVGCIPALLYAFAASWLQAQRLSPGDIDALPFSPPVATLAYGSEPQQRAELRLPKGRGPFPVVVVIHGGCWTKGYATLRNTAPIASALAERGLATWNVEYRQMGDPGGGWPGTYRDWGAAVDHLRSISREYALDLSRIAIVGHSAGAHAALWIAGRGQLPKDSEIAALNPLPIAAVFAIDGPADLVGMVGPDREVCGKPVVAPMMGGLPAAKPERYRDASPQLLLATDAWQLLVSATVLTASKANEYASLIKQKGGYAEVLVLQTGHFEPIAPARGEWKTVEDLVVKRMFLPAKIQP